MGGARPRVLAHRSGSDMEKLSPNLTRCHSYLKGVRSRRDRQRHYSFGVHFVSTKVNKGRIKRTKPCLVQFQLLEGGEVNYVS